MNLNQYSNYLSGDQFSNSLDIVVAKKEKYIATRMEYIAEIAANKKIIHVGCTDHIELIDRKIGKGRWLHSLLTQKTQECLGIDINEKAIKYVKEKYNYKNIINFNIFSEDIPEEIKKQKWDYMILGEVLEHVDNPVLFLSQIKERYSEYVDKIIISVPNAFRLLNFKKSLRNLENLNTDHRYWFSAYTMAKITMLAGMSLENIKFCEYYKMPLKFKKIFPRHVFKKILLKKLPILRECLVVIIKV